MLGIKKAVQQDKQMSPADSSQEENVSCVYCNDDREIKKKVHRVSQYWINFARWSLYCLSVICQYLLMTFCKRLTFFFFPSIFLVKKELKDIEKTILWKSLLQKAMQLDLKYYFGHL